MSLRSFHVVFVLAALLLGFAFGGWALSSGRPAVAATSVLATIALASYCRLFVRRLQRESASD